MPGIFQKLNYVLVRVTEANCELPEPRDVLFIDDFFTGREVPKMEYMAKNHWYLIQSLTINFHVNAWVNGTLNLNP